MSVTRPVFAFVVAIGVVAACGQGTVTGRPVDTIWVEGRTAVRELRAPADLVVIDAEQTATVLERNGDRAPLVVRFNPTVAEEVGAQFDEAFRQTRSAFLKAMEESYGQKQLASREINASRFRTFRNDFQSANPLIPVSLVLAQTWAKGYDGEGTRERLGGTLHAILTEHLVASLRPASELMLVSERPDAVRQSWSETMGSSRPVNPREVLSLEEAGLELRRRLDALDRGAAGFLSGLLQPNLVEDRYLTGLVMLERLGDKVEARAFSKGEIIAKAGGPIDRWAVLSVEHLTRAGLHDQAADGARAGLPDENSPAEHERGMVATRPPSRWPFWIVAAGGLFVLIGCLAWLGRKHLRSRVVTQLWVPPSDEVVDKTRLRTALLPHLARELKDRLVGALFAQRNALLQNEAAATQRVAELEARLAKLQPAIAERIRGYEQRIADLERELTVRDQETRELIRAKLVLARQELEAEMARNRIRWN